MTRYVIHNTTAEDTFEGKPLAYYDGKADWWTTKEYAHRYWFRRCAQRVVYRLIANGPDHWRLVIEKA